MFKEAVSEYIWLATCQGKIYENKAPSAYFWTVCYTPESSPCAIWTSGHVRGVSNSEPLFFSRLWPKIAKASGPLGRIFEGGYKYVHKGNIYTMM